MLQAAIKRAAQNESSWIRAYDLRGEPVKRSYAAFMDDVEALLLRMEALPIVARSKVGVYLVNCYEWLVIDVACTRRDLVIQAFPDEYCEPRSSEKELLAKHRLALFLDQESLLVQSITDPSITTSDISASCLLGDDINLVTDAEIFSKVYSSGTTGHLKGLNINRPGVEFTISRFVESFGISASDSTLIFLPFCNFQQRLQFYICLCTGASVAVSKFDTVFLDFKKYRPSFIIGPPVLFENLLDIYQYPRDTESPGRDAVARLREGLGGQMRLMITGMAPSKAQTLRCYFHADVPLYEAYGVTEVGMVAWNTPAAFRVGTVGKPLVNDIKFTAEGEVLVRPDIPYTKGYFEVDEKEAEKVFLDDGHIATGDVAGYDADGYLRLLGRRKNVIVTSSGVKFHPEEIEKKLACHPDIDEVCVGLEEATDRVTAIVVLKTEGCQVDRDRVETFVKNLNQDMQSNKQIAGVVFAAERFGVENGLLTRNMKLNRQAIYQHYLGLYYSEGRRDEC